MCLSLHVGEKAIGVLKSRMRLPVQHGQQVHNQLAEGCKSFTRISNRIQRLTAGGHSACWYTAPAQVIKAPDQKDVHRAEP